MLAGSFRPILHSPSSVITAFRLYITKNISVAEIADIPIIYDLLYKSQNNDDKVRKHHPEAIKYEQLVFPAGVIVTAYNMYLLKSTYI